MPYAHPAAAAAAATVTAEAAACTVYSQHHTKRLCVPLQHTMVNMILSREQINRLR